MRPHRLVALCCAAALLGSVTPAMAEPGPEPGGADLLRTDLDHTGEGYPVGRSSA